MKKIFISQPMNGISHKDILDIRENAIQKVKMTFGKEIEIIDSISFDDAPKESKGGLWYLGKSIMALSFADIAYFVKGFEYYRGCRIEHTCAFEYGIEIVYEDV